MVAHVMDFPPLPFSPAVIDAYVGTINQAYDLNGDRIDPEIGHNEGAFRYLVYQTISFLLPGNMRGLPVQIVQDNNSLVVREGERGLRAYPIGSSEFDNPWESFPTNRGGAPAAAARNSIQMSMFEETELHPESDGQGLEYILGHCGTSLLGLRAVHLCLPLGLYLDEKTIRQWGWVRSVWRADRDGPPMPTTRPGPSPIAPVVLTPRPSISIKPQVERRPDAR